ncbi:hypothetical protein MPSEU_000014100 [Mayamaea pseudoterrestris]|nr:hypothetical protein MPSEU_000014100 [Mayamaea pseudoterrestris]
MTAMLSRVQLFEGDLITPWALLLLGVTVASKIHWEYYLESLDYAVDSFLVPIYTLLAVLYLSSIAFSKQLEPLYHLLGKIASVLRLKSKSVATESVLPAPTLPIEIPSGLETEEQPFDLSGAYKLIENQNYEEFLGVQGVPRMYRGMANKARPVHRITHRGRLLTIKIEGIIESQTTYIIDGPPVQCDVRGRIFEDTMTYLDNNRTGIVVTKRALTEKYQITVQRELSEDGQAILMTSKATFTDGKDPVECIQKFKRIE